MNHDAFKILLVDDTPANLELLTDYLTQTNYQIFVAENGRSALERLRYLQPDLILLDIVMPGMNGFEVCEALKANPLTCQIPVIFLTAREEAADKVKGFAVGGVDYITKPLAEAEVLARVRTHLHLAQTQRHLREENYQLQQRLARQTGLASQNFQSAVAAPGANNHYPMLRLTLLGAFHLRVDGEARTDFRSDTVRALLAYLVLEGRQPQERVRLAEFFWPDYLPHTRLNSLRVALHNLRHLLMPWDDLLVADRKQVLFCADPAHVWCDALALEAGFCPTLLAVEVQTGGAVRMSAVPRFLAECETIESSHFQQWRQQRQAFYQALATSLCIPT